MTREEFLADARHQLARRMAWEASLTDYERWDIETSGRTPPVPEDFEVETDNDEQEETT